MEPSSLIASAPMSIEEGLKQTRGLVLYAGIPPEGDPLILETKAQKGQIILFLTSEEKKRYTLKDGEAGVTWDDDATVKQFLFDNVHTWMGGQVWGCSNERTKKLGGLLQDLVELYNFDQRSQDFLTKNNEPLRNMFRNYRYVQDGVPLRRAAGMCKGNPVVILAAGPSLNHLWPALREIQEKVPLVTFICAGRTYKEARKQGIDPSFVVEVEQFEWDDKIWMFAPPPNPIAFLCAPLTVCPGVLEAWPANVMILMDHNTAKTMGMELGKDSMDGGNSILHHMFNLATWLGAGQILLAGADLSYPPGSKDTHADGTFHGWPRDIQRTEHARQEPLEVTSTDGGKVMASPGYKNFATFLSIQIARAKKTSPSMEVFNLSKHGQYIEGTKFIEATEWTLKQPSSSPPPSSELSPLEAGAFSADWLPSSSLIGGSMTASVMSVIDPLRQLEGNLSPDMALSKSAESKSQNCPSTSNPRSRRNPTRKGSKVSTPQTRN